MKVVDELDKNLIKDHYIKLNNLLNLLSKTYKKGYNLNSSFI